MDKLDLILTEDQKNTINNIIKRVPKNEEELKRIFFKIEELLGFKDVRLYMTYPDASAFYNGKEINIEFEYDSSKFKKHGHDENICDMIICWEHDYNSLKVPVLEISTLSKNWLDLRQKAIQEYYLITMLRKSDETYEEKESKIKKIQELMDIYNFDHEEVIAYHMGITKSWLKHYYAIEKPECIGGNLECVKKDIDSKYLDLELDFEGLVPIVICKNCKNVEKCSLSRNKPIGYFFIFINNENRPRRVNYYKFSIKDEKCLSHCIEPSFNVWKTIRYKRI